MSDLLVEKTEQCTSLILNRTDKHNAFDDSLIASLVEALEQAIGDDQTRAIVLRANGKSFSAGADLNWMQCMVEYSEEQNYQDSMALARLMHLLHTSPKPTVAMVQGAAFGGGVGLVAACDIAIASQDALFCLSEVKLGLLPAVISPYVISAIGKRQASRYFLTAERFDAEQALNMGLVHHLTSHDELQASTEQLIHKIINNAPQAVKQSKELIHFVANQSIDEALIHHTAEVIAKKRVSQEGQTGLKAFLNKQKPNWN